MKRRRLLLLLAIWLGLAGGGWALGQSISEWAVIDVRPANEPEIHGMIMAVWSVYIATSAVPFVPGAEVGFGLIMVFGSRIVFLVYGGMVMALMLAWCIGRFVPPGVCAAVFGYLGLERARDLVLRTAGLDPAGRIAMLTENLPHRFVPFLLKQRYIALALAFNLPGNTLLGGGGGLAMAAGMSGLFPFAPFFLTVVLAVAPIPLLVLLTGYQP